MTNQKVPQPSDADPRIAFFDGLAVHWDVEGPTEQEITQRLQGLRDLLDLRPGQDLLEVGCGIGKATAWLVAQVAPGRVTAVDFSPAMIAKAREKRIDANFFCFDVCSDDLGEACYDIVLCFHSFPHFRDQPAALSNLAESLKADGRLIVIHLAGSDHINRFHAGLEGPVRGDSLPAGNAWNVLLRRAGLDRTRLVDREDLFFLEAVKRSGPNT